MNEDYYAGVYWPARKEPAETCAQRVESLLQGLGPLDPTWTSWYGTGRTREQALKKLLVPRASTFVQLFSNKKHQLLGGFSLTAWNGEPQGSTTGIILKCGLTSTNVCNSCTLNPPRQGPVAQRLINTEVMTRALRAMALAWEPEWGIATSHIHRAEVLKAAEPGTFVGWAMYFSRSRGTVPPLPAPVRIEPVEDKGTLVILTPERFTATHPAHVALAASIQERLGEAGLLRPLGG
ncbi:immunity 52 family protein [Myxococcus sp. RHSTA-1-4]|uniref:immunity 52 family protein n=1 Tax=Myxococcus sp. RHSTA-1-4 TaxID=2874601 RepID=UPI001CBAA727|nr:immunity 52 family protein [Myxococcus sp. RHSTA-1-4]MBZ4422109.1 immunity 52 family protein [Myxococcus sp. RHSTA-1-4]